MSSNNSQYNGYLKLDNGDLSNFRPYIIKYKFIIIIVYIKTNPDGLSIGV